MFCAGLVIAIAVASMARSDDLVRIGPDKKVIEWGWDEPDPAFMRAHAATMDQFGFDGVIFHTDAATVDGRVLRFDWNVWGPDRFEYAAFTQHVEDLKAAHATFKNMTDNFMRFNVCPGEVDWFDDEAFAVVVQNATVAGRVSKNGGCKGIMFDVEQYQGNIFRYGEQARADTKSLSEYQEKVRQRGQELMRGFQEFHPDITLMMTYGYGLSGLRGAGSFDLSQFSYGLLKNMLDGMYDAASGNTVIIDGFEEAYGFRTHAEYANARRRVESYTPAVGNPQQYSKHRRLAFGLWMDYGAGVKPWNADDIEQNYFLPEEFEYSVFCGLHVADRYVWVYTEQPKWWTSEKKSWWKSEKLPSAYNDALRRVRNPRRIDDAAYLGRKVKDAAGSGAVAASAQSGYSDEETFGDLMDKFDLVDLPKAWKFRTGVDGEGIKSGWYNADPHPDGWRDIVIGRFWDEQGLRYHGKDAWYRLTWDVPDVQVPEGSKLYLYFGAVDETATVWINGVAAGGHREHPNLGWEKRFPIDVTGKLEPGAVNTIAVRVGNGLFAGGIWKSVKLAVSK